MKEVFAQFFKNRILLTTFFAWIIAQIVKVSIGVVREKKINFRWFLGTGGMPSSHVAGASCLATCTGLTYGFDSIYVAICATFALVVMFDAQGVRRATGRQAKIINKIMEDIYWQGRVQEGRLREFIGHTPIEVIVGFLLGIVIALLLGQT
jgi:acid phosphatase family membrane protein YuiD